MTLAELWRMPPWQLERELPQVWVDRTLAVRRWQQQQAAAARGEGQFIDGVFYRRQVLKA